jgi:peptidoglycan/LPS O-acetylase OafA/YrhL
MSQKLPAPQNLKSLTSLRFFAAMWVVLFHYWPDLGSPKPTPVGKGYLGVELFFVLSGFILSHVYMPQVEAGTYRHRDFLWTRLARIYPVHIALLVGLAAMIVALTLIGVHAGSQLIVWSSLPAQITLTQAWGPSPQGGWNYPSWSISAEWLAYLCFPAFAFVILRLGRRPVVALTVALAGWIVVDLLFRRLAGQPLTDATILWGALRIVPSFFLGCAAWLVWRHERVSSTVPALILTIASLLVLVFVALVNPPDEIAVFACTGLVLGLASLNRLGISPLSSSTFIFLGEVSFAIYMVSIPWQLVFSEGLAKVAHVQPHRMPAALWLVMVAGVVPAGAAAHLLIEKPAREALRRIWPTRNQTAVRPPVKIEDRAQ